MIKMKPRFLITGATGFTGIHMRRFLEKHKISEVHSTAREHGNGIEACDLQDSSLLESLLKNVRPDGIFHCAGSFSNSWETDFRTNVCVTRSLLEALRATGLRCRVLLIGSAAEYGFTSGGAVQESSPLHPISIYGLTKSMQTALMNYCCRRYGMDIVMARTFNLYGEGCSPLLFPGRVLQQVREVQDGLKKKIEVRSLDSSRDYLDVSAAVGSYLRIMRHGTGGEVYNVGSGQPVRMDGLLLDLISPFGLSMSDVEVLADDAKAKTDVPMIYADITKLNQLPSLELM